MWPQGLPFALQASAKGRVHLPEAVHRNPVALARMVPRSACVPAQAVPGRAAERKGPKPQVAPYPLVHSRSWLAPARRAFALSAAPAASGVFCPIHRGFPGARRPSPYCEWSHTAPALRYRSSVAAFRRFAGHRKIRETHAVWPRPRLPPIAGPTRYPAGDWPAERSLQWSRGLPHRLARFFRTRRCRCPR